MTDIPEPPAPFIKSTVRNDVIDYDRIKVGVTIEKVDEPKELRIRFKGKCIDYSIVNAIRRTVDSDVPIYAFSPDRIVYTHEKSLSMYNGDMLRHSSLEMLPIYDVNNPFDLESPNLYLSTEVLKSIFSELFPEGEAEEPTSEEEVEKKLEKITMVISYKNNTDTNHFLGTHDAVLKINDVVVDNYKRYPHIPFVVLKPGEELHIQAQASLGTARIHARYEACTVPYHIMVADDEYILSYETLGQIDKFMILNKALTILIKKLQNLGAYVRRKYPSELEERDVSIELIGQDSTIGGIYENALQKSPYVRAAAFKTPHPMNPKIVIEYRLEDDSPKGIIEVFLLTTDYLVRVFQAIMIAEYKNTE